MFSIVRSLAQSLDEDVQAAAAANRSQQTLNQPVARAMTPWVLVVALRAVLALLLVVRTLLVGTLLLAVGTVRWRRAVVTHVLLLVVASLGTLGWILAAVGGLGRRGVGVVRRWGTIRLARHLECVLRFLCWSKERESFSG